MNSRTWNRTLTALGALVATTAMFAVTAGGALADVDSCSQTMQDANLCLGYYTTDGAQDPVIAAIAGAMAAGNVPGAYEFYLGATQYLDATEAASIDAAFDAEAEVAGEGAAVLYTYVESVVPPMASSAVVPGEIYARQAAQTKHGNCCATSAYTWQWDGHDVNYGYCEEGPYGVYCKSTATSRQTSGAT